MTLYSHSRLASFENCKLKFKFKYIDKIKTDIETSIEGFLGFKVHDTLEKLYSDLKNNKQNSLDDLINYYNTQWNEGFNENIMIVRTEFSSEDYRQKGEVFIKDYYNKHHPFDDSKTLGLEEKVIIDLYGDGKYKLVGYIDRLSMVGNDTIDIIDYKTSARLPWQETLDKERQLALYSLAVKESYPSIKEIRLVWHYLAHNKTMMSSRTDEELESLKRTISNLIDTIESTTEFEPTEGPLCNWCEFIPVCPRR